MFFRYNRDIVNVTFMQIFSRSQEHYSSFYTALAFLLCFCFFVIGARDIGKQAMVDEPLWIFDRIESYSASFLSGDLLGTRINDKPGITIAILGTPSRLAHAYPSTIQESITPEEHEHLTALMRLPILAAGAILLLLLFFVVRRLTNQEIALASVLMIALSPHLLGIARIINPDALLWILLPLSFFLIWRALLFPSRTTVIYAGTILGLGLLTKYIANLIFVMMPLLSALIVIYDRKKDITLIQSQLKRHIIVYMSITFIALAVYILMLPSTWIRPIDILRGTLFSEAFIAIWGIYVGLMFFFVTDTFLSRRPLFSTILFYLRPYHRVITIFSAITVFMATLYVLLSTILNNPLHNFQLALQSPKSALSNTDFLTTFLSGFYNITFGLHPLMLALFLVTCLVTPLIATKKQQLFITGSLLFIVVYYLGSAIGGVAPTLRYQIGLFPLVFFVCACGTFILGQRLLLPSQVVAKRFLYGGLTITLIASLYTSTPFYLSYHNSFLPTNHLFDYKNMGDGSYHAAAYLNSLPYAENLSIWSDKSGVCRAFVGSCTTTVKHDRILEDKLVFQYFVTTPDRAHQVIRESKSELKRRAAPRIGVYNFEQLYTKVNIPLHTIKRSQSERSALHIYSAKESNIAGDNPYAKE